MPPPPAEPFATRIFLGPALRTQPDRRLVKLVREGYEAAFDEIVRRYRAPLDRFAAAIVGGRSEDVTQDAFSKALLALRGTTTEIELKPWLFRIVRNTALNDLRDGPPPAEELGEAVPGGRSAAEVAEGREEIGELMERLRALPEPQRAAIVMRELEGLSHEEIAAALGVSGGAARQAIYRARLALRDGLGMLVPLPLLRLLIDHGAEAAGASAGGLAAAGAASAGGGGAALGGFGAGAALKVGVATALVAGSVGAGVAIQHERHDRGAPAPAEASRGGQESGDAGRSPGPNAATTAAFLSDNRGRGRGGHGGDGRGPSGGREGGTEPRHGSDRDSSDDGGDGDLQSENDGPGRRPPGHGGPGPSAQGHPDSEDEHPDATSGGSHSARHGSGDDGTSGSSGNGSGSSRGGSGSRGSSGSGSGGDSGGGTSGGDSKSGTSGGDGHDEGSAETEPATAAGPPPEAPVSGGSGESESGSGSGGSSSGGDSGKSDSGGGEDDL